MATPTQPSSEAETEGIGRRQLRAVSLIAVALIVVAAASFAYLRPPPTLKQATSPVFVDPLLVSNIPVNYQFITPSIGWASLVVPGPSPDSGQFQIFRTVDGAKHWQQQLVGQSSSNGFSPFTIQFFDQARGFMATGGPGGQFYRTTDGGAHWGSDGLPPSPIVEVVTFSDSSYGWLLSTSDGQARYLYATSDGGNSWQRLPDPPADAIGLNFRRPSEAWMGGSGLGTPHVYSSDDAGQSWQRHDLPAPADGAWDPTVGYDVVGDLLPIAGVAFTAFCQCSNSAAPPYFTSSDSGTTWRLLSPPGFVAYQDSTHWWSTSPDGVFKSADAGRSWKLVGKRASFWRFDVLSILDPSHAWASLRLVGGFGLALTSDGGRHWTLAKVPNAT